MKVYIDAGHGADDCGAVLGKRYEKNDVLKLSLAVGEKLTARGVEVRYSRTKDIEKYLAVRTREANEWKADYFLSIHRDAYEHNKAQGVSAYIYSKCKVGDKIYNYAKLIVDNLAKLGFKNRGVHIGAPSYTDFAVNRDSLMPSCLLEVGFIDSDSDNKLFDGKFDEIAKAIADSVCESFGVPIKETAAKKYYRIRKSWDDADSQIGAYEDLANAKAACKLGYSIYDDKGKAIFVLGDMDGDGRVTAKDARKALRASAGLAKLSIAEKELADIDHDGRVSAKDARAILKFAAKL